jgi:hypothetical protein
MTGSDAGKNAIGRNITATAPKTVTEAISLRSSHDSVTVKMASKSHCEECGRLVACYLREVARHAALLEERAELQENPGDINWLIRQTEWRIREVRKEFSAHRANHSSK